MFDPERDIDPGPRRFYLRLLVVVLTSAAACVALPYVFISRAMFPGQERQQERSLEEHYLRHRILILTILMIPPLASAISKVVLDRTQDYGLKEVWLGTRLVMPLILMPLKTRTGQRVGLGVFLALEFAGLFR